MRQARHRRLVALREGQSENLGRHYCILAKDLIEVA